MTFSHELTIIFAAVGAVIFLFVMDYYYRRLEERASEKEGEATPAIGPVEAENDETFAA